MSTEATNATKVDEAPPAFLTMTNVDPEDWCAAFSQKRKLIGRDSNADIPVRRTRVSRRHAEIWADSAYPGFIEFAVLLLGLVVSIVCRRKGSRGFKVQPRRWVVERTFGWLTRWRRLNRNY